MLNVIPKDKKLILFDGVCNLCNSSIQYVIKHDKNDVFLFAPLESEIAQKIINHFNIDTAKTDSIILYSEEKGVAFKSTAALKIALKLGFPQKLLSIFFIVPTFIRNWVYNFIAKNRYKWFGKKEACMVPTEALKSKFLN